MNVSELILNVITTGDSRQPGTVMNSWMCKLKKVRNGRVLQTQHNHLQEQEQEDDDDDDNNNNNNNAMQFNNIMQVHETKWSYTQYSMIKICLTVLYH